MSQAVVVAGWSLGIGTLLLAGAAGCRAVAQAEAIACACHELRGPLTAARLGVEIALRGGDSADGRLRAIELELERASLALEDLAEAWQRRPLGRSRVCEPRGQVDVAELLADSVEAWQGAASSRGVALRLVAPGAGAVVWGDRLRLAQVTGNLIANAIEHGGGEVEASWRLDPGGVRIEVVDGGGGLPAPVAELARPSRPTWSRPGRGWFARQRWPGNPRGHGLAIASAIAAAHGGRLSAAPSERGARLVLELPNVEAEPLQTPAGV